MTTIHVPKSAGSRALAHDLADFELDDNRPKTILLDFSETIVAAPSFVDEIVGLCFDLGAEQVQIHTHSQRIRDYVLRSARLRGLGSHVTFASLHRSDK